MSDILAILILDEDTGKPLYSHFLDAELKRNPSLIPQKLRAREIVMIHELGINLNLVFSLLAEKDLPALKERLKLFRDRVEKTYPKGMREGSGNWADHVILENMVRSIFIDQQE